MGDSDGQKTFRRGPDEQRHSSGIEHGDYYWEQQTVRVAGTHSVKRDWREAEAGGGCRPPTLKTMYWKDPVC